MDADESGHDERHFPAAELDTSEPCRNPLDPSPYPEDDPEGVSFPSIFMPLTEGTGSDMAEAELKNSWGRLKALISKCLATDSTPGDTVDMVRWGASPPHPPAASGVWGDFRPQGGTAISAAIKGGTGIGPGRHGGRPQEIPVPPRRLCNRGSTAPWGGSAAGAVLPEMTAIRAELELVRVDTGVDPRKFQFRPTDL